MTRSLALRTLLACSAALPGVAGDAWDAAVRGTEARTPDQERAGFKLPPGFEIQLVASEPQIGKPLNLAFDAKGRLWVTSTVEYPWPVKNGTKGRDTIVVLGDIGEDGKARSTTVFADGLNIPIGLYPYRNGVIAHSIPDISYFEDSDGDGKADKRTKLYGDVGTDDTHGMVNAFRRGPDGWLYACHGFKNRSTLRGSDGQAITLNSGNTFRMRVDGSHVGHYTLGQVNPFGMAFDDYGNLYSSDCHTRPVYQLMHDGRYPTHFTNAVSDDGLGFVPEMMEHMHGSTGLCGLAWWQGDSFPKEYADNLFVCNVVTSRVNRDTLATTGSSRRCVEASDFVTCDDPWFRPVDLQVGPDGALYIADFYNRIIGHYEVDLKHPGRDRERGRIWRIVWKGAGAKPATAPDLSSADAAALIAALGAANPTVRRLAMDQLSDRIGKAAVPALTAMLATSTNPPQRFHGWWALHRLDALDADALAKAAGDAAPQARYAAMNILAERAGDPASLLAALVVPALGDADAFVRRGAADALGRHPDPAWVKPLLAALKAAPAADGHLAYKLRQALRNQLFHPGVVLADAQAALGLGADDLRALADLATAASSPAAAGLLLARLAAERDDTERVVRYARHAARNLVPERLGELTATLRKRDDLPVGARTTLFTALKDAYAQRGLPLDDALRGWGGDLAVAQLADVDPANLAWSALPVPGAATSPSPWTVQERAADDGVKSPYLSSLPKGEKLTGILRSRAFAAPARLTFFVAGHNGPPGNKDAGRNHIRLRDAVSGELLMEADPPRDDTARQIVWDLAKAAGHRVVIDLIDGDARDGYAWLAVGRFEPAIVPVEIPRTDLRQAADLARDARVAAAAPSLLRLLAAANVDADTRVAAADALATIDADAHLPALLAIIADTTTDTGVRGRIAAIVGRLDRPAGDAALAGALKTGAWQLQVQIATALAGSPRGAGVLLDQVAAGSAPARLLLERAIAERVSTYAGMKERADKLTKGLPPVTAEREALIAQRAEHFRTAKLPADAVERGGALFATTCGICHRLGGKGALIGPQLDGIGVRGAERLLEDILDPNRNVDRAFRQSVITLKDGQLVLGMVRREEGETVVVADIAGKETSVAKANIASRSESTTSLMPEAFGQLIQPDDLDLLIAYLLKQR